MTSSERRRSPHAARAMTPVQGGEPQAPRPEPGSGSETHPCDAPPLGLCGNGPNTPGRSTTRRAVRHPQQGRSLVLTIDVITPIVDDPRAFGAIAGANALSDVWAMGGRPEVALSFIGFPTDKLPLEVLAEALAGMNDACAGARTAICRRPHHQRHRAQGRPRRGRQRRSPSRVWSHRGAREGPRPVLTSCSAPGLPARPSGRRRLPRAGRRRHRPDDGPQRPRLRRRPRPRATSCTDVNRFGSGHLATLDASGLDADLDASSVPLDGAPVLAERRPRRQPPQPGAGAHPRQGRRRERGGADPPGDAQTSGGPLLCLPED